MLANILWLVVLFLFVATPGVVILRAEEAIIRVKQDHITLRLDMLLTDLAGILVSYILPLVLIVTFHSGYALPPRWVWWCIVIWCLIFGSGLFYRGKTLQSGCVGLLYIVMAAAIWYVFLHLSLFAPAPSANTPVPQTAIEQQAQKSS